MSLRRLLWIAVVTNLATNLLLAVLVVSLVVLPWARSLGEGEPRAAGASLTPMARAAEPDPEGQKPQAAPKAAPAPTPREKAGLSPEVWARLEAGEVVQERIRQDQKIALRAHFMVQAPPERLFLLFTDYPNIPGLYEEVKETRVLERGADFAVVYYKSRYGFFTLDWVVKESFAKDKSEIRWTIVKDPRHPSKLLRADGFWRFHAVSPNLTLLSYQNHFEMALLPTSLLQQFAAQNIPGIARNIQKRVAAGK